MTPDLIPTIRLHVGDSVRLPDDLEAPRQVVSNIVEVTTGAGDCVALVELCDDERQRSHHFVAWSHVWVEWVEQPIAVKPERGDNRPINSTKEETMNTQPHPLPVRILANMTVAPIAFVTAPLWLPFALYFEKRRNSKASQ